MRTHHLLLACVLSASPLAAADFPLQALLVQGESVPGQPGMSFEIPDRVALNDAGQAVVMTEGTAGDRFWGRASAGAEFVSLLGAGDAAPGITDVVIENFASQPAWLAETGVVAVRVGLEGPGATGETDVAVYALDARNGEARLIARQGDPAPGTSTHYAGLSQQAWASDDGPITVAATLAGLETGAGHALFLDPDDGGPAAPLLVPGDPAPDLPDLQFTGAELTPVVDGKVLVRAYLSGPGVTADNDEGLWHGPASRGAQDLLLRKGDPLPGGAPGAVIDEFLEHGIRADGKIMLEVQILDGGLRHSELHVMDPVTGTTMLQIREGDPVAGIPGAQIQSMNQTLRFARFGGYALSVTLAGADITPDNNMAVLRGDDSGFQLVAREGVELRNGAGADAGSMINPHGHFALSTRVDGLRILHAVLDDGGIHDIAAPGDVVAVGAGSRTIEDVRGLRVANRGSFDAFTSTGMLGFLVGFDDGSEGVVVANTNIGAIFRDGFE